MPKDLKTLIERAEAAEAIYGDLPDEPTPAEIAAAKAKLEELAGPEFDPAAERRVAAIFEIFAMME